VIKDFWYRALHGTGKKNDNGLSRREDNMTVVKSIASVVLVLVCALNSATVAMAGSKPQFITIDAPGAGQGSGQGTGCFAYSDCSVIINNFGAITGYYLDANNVFHGFVRSPEGKFTSFQAPGADTAAQDFNGTNPNAINDAGAITGVYFDAQSVAHGFLRTPEGGIATFDPPGSTGTVPVALNLESDVVGYYVNQSGLFEAFLRRADGTFATWSDPNACNYSGNGPSGNLPFCGGTAAFNIDVFGVVAGAYTDNSANAVHHGLIRIPGGKLQDYEVPGAGNGPGDGTSCPGCSIGINVFGAIAGYYIDANSLVHGYLRSSANRTATFVTPGSASVGTNCYADCPLGLNDWGAITGIYIDVNGVSHGFLRTPDGKVSSFDDPRAPGLTPQQPWFWSGTNPVSINDEGMIAGFYIDAANVSHGFLLLP
jgi:hypothetical protein